mmetsp:Transcript_34019/g.68522  ORF Transcript_34019/g.68522 Transcript_34019/m.68522 type:complete len:114 (-) Transcript_34019:1492-1833(-)
MVLCDFITLADVLLKFLRDLVSHLDFPLIIHFPLIIILSGGRPAGIHARDRNGNYLTIVETIDFGGSAETTGLAFSPDNMHMYFASQDDGVLFDITRTDGLPFGGDTLNIKYH